MLKPEGKPPKKGPDRRPTRRQALEAIERKTGRRPAALNGPDCPVELLYVWEWYCSARPIDSLAELQAWAQLHGRRLLGWEVDLLRRLARVEERVAAG